MNLKVNLERDVLKGCVNRLDYWKINKVCIHYQRLNSGVINIGNRYVRMCSPGTPDLVAYLVVGKICHVVWFECKRVGGRQSAEQKQFQSKFNYLDNAHYMIVTNPGQIDMLIDKITGYTDKTFDEMNKHMEN